MDDPEGKLFQLNSKGVMMPETEIVIANLLSQNFPSLMFGSVLNRAMRQKGSYFGII